MNIHNNILELSTPKQWATLPLEESKPFITFTIYFTSDILKTGYKCGKFPFGLASMYINKGWGTPANMRGIKRHILCLYQNQSMIIRGIMTFAKEL